MVLIILLMVVGVFVFLRDSVLLILFGASFMIIRYTKKDIFLHRVVTKYDIKEKKYIYIYPYTVINNPAKEEKSQVVYIRRGKHTHTGKQERHHNIYTPDEKPISPQNVQKAFGDC